MCIVHTCPRGIQIWSYMSKYFHFLINVCFGERRGRIFGNPSPELTCWISHLKQDKPRVLCRGEKEQKGRNYNYLYDCIVFFSDHVLLANIFSKGRSQTGSAEKAGTLKTKPSWRDRSWSFTLILFLWIESSLVWSCKDLMIICVCSRIEVKCI